MPHGHPSVSVPAVRSLPSVFFALGKEIYLPSVFFALGKEINLPSVFLALSK